MGFLNATPLRRSKPGEVKVIGVLKEAIGHDRWFIAGSYANTKVKRPSDIDVFFYSDADRDEAIKSVTTYVDDKNGYRSFSTNDAETFSIPDINLKVQLIKRHTGTIAEVFDSFDLNVCKVGLRPDGTRPSAHNAHEDIKIEKINARTFQRYFKYMRYFGQDKKIQEHGKMLLDKYIADGTVLKDYYIGKEKIVAVNKSIFDIAVHNCEIPDYAYEQARLYAPELLL